MSWNAVPGFALRQRYRHAPDHREVQIDVSEQGDIGESAPETECLARPRPGSFRKHDQVATLPKGIATGRHQHVRRQIAADITGRLHNAAQEGISPQRGFDDAERPWTECHQQHYIEQCRVVGDDQPAVTRSQPASPLNLDADQPDQAQKQEIELEHPANNGLRPPHRVRRPQSQHR